MRGGIGATLTRNDEQFIAADYRHVTLRSLDDDFTRVVDAEELARLTNVTWHTERAESATDSAARVLDGLPEQERRIVGNELETEPPGLIGDCSPERACVDRQSPDLTHQGSTRSACKPVTEALPGASPH